MSENAGHNCLKANRLDRRLTRTLRLLLRAQKNSNITADLYELGPPEYEETNPTTDPPSQPETGNPPTTCDDRRPADDATEICYISDSNDDFP